MIVMMMARTPSLNASSRVVFILANLWLDLSEPMARSVKVIIGQAVRGLCETNRHIGPCTTKKVCEPLCLGCRNNWIVITRADPNTHRRKVGQFVRNQRHHGAK